MTTEAQVEDRRAQRGARRRVVSILYNGVEKEFRYRPQLRVGELLAEAIAAFGIAANQHLLSLFDASGAELDDASTLRDAGVEPGDEFVLRPSAVKGG